MNYDYAIHSDFLIHWTGKDIDNNHDEHWDDPDKSTSNKDSDITNPYLSRLRDILKHGLWMTSEPESNISIDGLNVTIPSTPKTCFTELKLSESRKHARKFGRLGIGIKRPFLFKRFGRPLTYYGYHEKNITNDIFFQMCANDLTNRGLLNFFKPMNSSSTLNYDLYSESEWRIIFIEKLLSERFIINPRDPKNKSAHTYFNSLLPIQQDKKLGRKRAEF